VNVAEIVGVIESAGAAFRFDGKRVRVWYPDEARRDGLVEEVAFLLQHRTEVAAFLRDRQSVPEMPQGLHLIQWSSKKPPVAIETCSVVTDPALFARTTLEQLRAALSQPSDGLDGA